MQCINWSILKVNRSKFFKLAGIKYIWYLRVSRDLDYTRGPVWSHYVLFLVFLFFFSFLKQVQMYLLYYRMLQCLLALTMKLHWTFGIWVCTEFTFLGEIFLYSPMTIILSYSLKWYTSNWKFQWMRHTNISRSLLVHVWQERTSAKL